MQTSTFWIKFGSLSPATTLKIMSRSPKPNQLFSVSQCYIYANLVKICQLVHEISCRQETILLMPVLTPTSIGSTPKTTCPVYLITPWWPLRLWVQYCFSMSHILMVKSALPVASNVDVTSNTIQTIGET